MITIWITRHVQALLGSLGRLVRNPLSTLLTMLVIGLALSLPLGLKLFVSNAQVATGGFADAVDMSVFFKPGVSLDKVQQLARSARQRSGVASANVITSDEALVEFRKYSGFGDALKALPDNPLPHVLHVTPTADGSSPAALEALQRYFTAWPEVDLVQSDADWVLRFNAILVLLERVLLITAILLGIGVAAVIGNTIRLEIQGRRAEIEVTKLVGGSNAFVRRPFLYTGVLYGLTGGLFAWGISAGARAALADPVSRLSGLYGSHFALAGPDPHDVGVLLLGAAVLGWLGAFISTARHLWRIQPRV